MFAGTTNDILDEVSLTIYAGSAAAGVPVQTLTVLPLLEETWTRGLSEPLADGTYTAVATQTNLLLEAGMSVPVTFTVDTAAPSVTLSGIVSPTSDPTPGFGGEAGVAPGDLGSVELKIYSGWLPVGPPVQTLGVTPNGSAWQASAQPLADGTYTAQAEQSDEAGNTAGSEPASFTVDTVAPVVSLASVTSPTTNSKPSFSGNAGVASGDIPSIKLKIYTGAGTSGSPLRTRTVPPTGDTWTVGPIAALEAGTYTAQAEQSDEAGNVRKSQPSIFTIALPVPVTTTTTTTSATATSTTEVTTTTTTITTVSTAAPAGSSSTSTDTPAISPHAALMQPFPIVRIAGFDTARGVRLRLITVQAPAQARITMQCRGRGCPHKPESRIAAAGKTGTVVVEFKQFERSLLAGAVLTIRVSEPGEIGKYTRFQIRRGRLPGRVDTCLDSTGTKSIECPS